MKIGLLKRTHSRALPSARALKASFAALLGASLLFGHALAGGGIEVPIKPSPQGPPEGWQVKEWKGKADFKVVKEDFGPAIHLKSERTSSALYKDVEFELKDYPYLSWKWKVTALPQGADVREKSKDDQAAQVYVIFPKWPAMVNSKVVGYIWDTSAPAGSSVRSTKTGNTRYMVLKSGPDGLGAWHSETRNVYEDYKKLFNEEPPRIGKVSVMIDSDDTRSSAESFIGDIRFSNAPPSGKPNP
ncbi:MAG: DUF3047 domain-containing protein [Deltaproteobacteria bacterium]|nr:DUF3047 domain-containing protein [Deltaproteobacteria bacterium]MBZ0219577.1 DUF3047 domain-containing protein [Deltaproteobacteria bacterium]